MKKTTTNLSRQAARHLFDPQSFFSNNRAVNYLKRRWKNTGFLILLLVSFAAFTGCEKGLAQGNKNCPPVELIKNPFVQSQKEIKATLDGIFKSIQDKDADKLISFHIYGPKFTEFKDSEKRVGPVENEQYERGLVGAVSAFDYSLNDLKIDVFGDVSVVTFHADFRPTINGVVGQIQGGVTLVFVKVDNAWKITHEHFSPLA